MYDSDSFQPDPNGILQWLVRELQDAEDRGLYVWIIGHLSPGKSDCLREPSRYFNEIIRRYNDTVRSVASGGLPTLTRMADLGPVLRPHAPVRV